MRAPHFAGTCVGLLAAFLAVAPGQEMAPGTPAAGAGSNAAYRVTLPSGKSFEVGSPLTSEEEFPPEQVLAALQACAWEHVARRAAEFKGAGYSHDRPALQNRQRYKDYFAANYAGWKAPGPRALPEGKLRNLADAPTKPRFPLAGKVWPAKPGEASVCLWEDDKVAAYSFSNDDNNALDLPFWKELSKKYGDLKITFNLVVNNIDGVLNKGQLVQCGTWEGWRVVVREWAHVASHSMGHVANAIPQDGWPGADFEAAESQRLLDANLAGFKTRLFVYPGGTIPEFGYAWFYRQPPHTVNLYRPSAAKYYAGARGGSGNPINPANMTDYFNIRTTQGAAQCLGPGAMFDITKVLDPDAKNAFYRGWVTTFTHGVKQGQGWGEDPFSAGHAKVFDWVTAHREDIWIGFLDDVALYGQERDTATVETRECGDGRIVLALTSRMDPEVFDYPLTVKVCLPDGWKGARATQGGKEVPARAVVHEQGTYLLVKAVPDRGEVVLSRGG
jgi:hypothetical protein